MVLVGSRSWVVRRGARSARPQESLRQKISGRLRGDWRLADVPENDTTSSKLLPIIAEILAIVRNHRVGPGLLRDGRGDNPATSVHQADKQPTGCKCIR